MEFCGEVKRAGN